jgi:hypothetical protein
MLKQDSFDASDLVGATAMDFMRDPWCPLCAGRCTLTDNRHSPVRCMDCAEHIRTETREQLLARRERHLCERGEIV